MPSRLSQPNPTTPGHTPPQDTWDNLASACVHCNSRKGSLLVSELPQVGMRLLKYPHAPTAIELAQVWEWKEGMDDRMGG